MKKVLMTLAALSLLVACGGGTTGKTGTIKPAGSIEVDMTDFKFSPNTATASAGKVVFFVVNNAPATSHNMVIREHATKKRIAGSDLLSAGDSSVFTVASIAAGTYDYFCDQPGHEGSGMIGTLTIT